MLKRTCRSSLFTLGVALCVLCQTSCKPCFVEGTLVSTPSGPIAIEDLKIGDEVVTLSPLGQLRIGRITATHSTKANGYLEIAVDDLEETLRVTPNHRIAAATTWRTAQDLEIGDLVQTKGGLKRIHNTSVQSTLVRVFDITVQPDHNFFANGILVHNKTPIPDNPPELSGVWLGHVSNERFCYLEVRPDGSGYFADKIIDGPIHRYKIRRATLDQSEAFRYDVRVDLDPINKGANLLYLHGRIVSHSSFLGEDFVLYFVSSPDDRWPAYYILEREDHFNSRLRAEHTAKVEWDRLRIDAPED